MRIRRCIPIPNENNRANQLNPNNPAYWSVRDGSHADQALPDAEKVSPSARDVGNGDAVRSSADPTKPSK